MACGLILGYVQLSAGSGLAVKTGRLTMIERYLGGSKYANLNKKKRSANIIAGILALPLLIFSLFLFFSRYQKYFSFGFDMENTMETLFLMIIEYPWAVILYAVAFTAMVFYFYRLNSQSMAEVDKIIHAFMTQSPSIIKPIIK
ncbi:DUF6097 family protein [Brenneria goodwinii]|uniref:DUF6097 family protein n=1 Tax=Brenneria goodwinii TaxID=1109412 RepID=UPI0036EAFDAD